MSTNPAARPPDRSLRQLVAHFARPKPLAAWWQLSTTAAAFLATWALMAASLDWGYGWTLALAPLAAGLYIRLFIIQHDCGHGSFFAKRWLDHAVGAVLGLITLVPYGYWKKTHSVHHATSGNLDRRELGDVRTLTVAEYRALPRLRQFGYRLYRSVPVLFVLGPIYQFVLKHRFPFDLPFAWKREWASVLWNNLALAVAAWVLGATMGWWTLLLVHGPIMLIAGAAGVWLFYVQHQFEEAYWEQQENWDFEAAALAGSSFYDLPRVLHWFTGNIGYHHIHHLGSKVPNYRLRECYESSPLLQRAPRLSLRASLRCARLKLWDPEARKLVGFPSRRRLEA